MDPLTVFPWTITVDISGSPESPFRLTDVMKQDAERLMAFLSGRAVPVGGLDESDWDRIIELARRHGIAQLLPACWKAQGTVPPSAASERIQTIHLASAVRNIRLFHELEIIVRGFKAAGITVVPLKGAWFAESLYANIAQRAMGDVDLWARAQFQYAGVHRLAINSGAVISWEEPLQRKAAPLRGRTGCPIRSGASAAPRPAGRRRSEDGSIRRNRKKKGKRSSSASDREVRMGREGETCEQGWTSGTARLEWRPG